MAPPLTGAAFLAKFGGRGLDHLQSVIRTMPPADPTAVSDTAATDLLAFIAQHNAVIASDTELSGDPSLLAAVSLPNGSFMAGSPYAPPPVPIDRPDPFRNWRPVTAEDLANPPAEGIGPLSADWPILPPPDVVSGAASDPVQQTLLQLSRGELPTNRKSQFPKL